MSPSNGWVTPFSVTFTSETVPLRPLATMFEGYGVAVSGSVQFGSGMVMVAALAKTAACAGGATARTVIIVQPTARASPTVP